MNEDANICIYLIFSLVEGTLMRVYSQLYHVYTSIIIVFYAEHFLKMVIKAHILVCSHNKTTTDHAIKHIKNINGPRKGCLTTQDTFPDHSFFKLANPIWFKPCTC